MNSKRQSNVNPARRQFLREAAGVAVVFSVPAWAMGCGSEDSEDSEKWETRAKALEAKGDVLTMEAPGKWAGKQGTHVPRVKWNGDGTVTVTTPHVMDMEHYIETQYIRNQDGKIIGLDELTPKGEDEAVSTFKLPAGTTKIVAYSYCNLHDLWMDESSKA